MSDSIDFDLDQFKVTYFEECSELLGEAEMRLARVRDTIDNVDAEDLHAIFRAVHSVKGGGGAFEFTNLVKFAHELETLLDLMRTDEIPVTLDGIDLLISANDVLVELVQSAQLGLAVDEKKCADLVVLLKQASGTEDDTPTEDTDANDGPAPELDVTGYVIKFSPHPHLYRHANEPILLIREMASLGELKTTINLDRLPAFEKLTPDEAYFSWTFELTANCPLRDVEEVFEFVEDDCDLTITPIAGTPDNTAREPVPDTPPEESPSDKPAETPAAKSAPPAAVPDSNRRAGDGGGAPGVPATISSIRVDLNRVDRLVNMVGELVITQAMLRQQANDMTEEMSPLMSQGFEDLGMHTRDLQESVMAVRMQPVKSVFARMPRLVRDLSAKLDKKIDLVMKGEETVVDKTVVELLSDPLTHMIRNSLDHGIESKEDRAKTDKPERAKIVLSAEHRSGRIQIEVSDDGQGINRERVIEKAIENGVIPEDHNLSIEETENLIFAPGFSTASEVTEVSGRGVGMDVVRRNIANLGGRVSVRSEPGQGTRFLMTLPLTLAVLDGMIVRVGQEKFIVPLTSIIESIRPQKEHLSQLTNGADVVSVRGDFIRIIPLNRLLDVPDGTDNPAEGLLVIAEIEGGSHVALLVDELLGQQQVVIKSLEENYDRVNGISAATILGNGMVALILDLDGLNSMAQSTISLKPRALPKSDEILRIAEQ